MLDVKKINKNIVYEVCNFQHRIIKSFDCHQ
jgi:hypothetical protein